MNEDIMYHLSQITKIEGWDLSKIPPDLLDKWSKLARNALWESGSDKYLQVLGGLAYDYFRTQTVNDNTRPAVKFVNNVGFAEKGDRGWVKDRSPGMLLVHNGSIGRTAWVDKSDVSFLNTITPKQLPLWEGEL